jgi:hypothetical protein
MILSVSLYADNAQLNRLIRERDHQLQVFLSLQDSSMPGKMTKTYLLNDQLLKMMAIDDSIIGITNQLSLSESKALDSLNLAQESISKLKFDNETMQQRTKNDLRMQLIMKIAIAILFVSLLIVIYFLFKKKGDEEEVESKEEIKLLDFENEKAELRLEIDRAKMHESNLRIELESSIRNLQDQLNSVNDRYKVLETENINLKMVSSQRVSENENTATQVERLKIQNETLIRESGELQKQLMDAKSKNDSIMKKIAKLISDLSAVNA